MNLKSLHRAMLMPVLVSLASIGSQLSPCFAQSALSILCPSNIVVSACDSRGTVVAWPGPQLVSNGIPSAAVVDCTPPSGSLFPVGVTVVSCEALGSTSNRVQCRFSVTVQLCSAGPGAGFDDDGNGLPDIWQIVFKAGGLAPGGDTDGDGLTNGQEAVAGTSPFDPSFIGGVYVAAGDIETSIGTDGSVRPVRFGISTAQVWGKRYRFQVTPKLGDPWMDVAANSHCGFRINLADTNIPSWMSPRSFFRAAVSDIDEDRDGLTAWEENILATSDRSADTGGWGHDWVSGGTAQDGTNSSSGGAGDDVLIGGITSYDEGCPRGVNGRDILIGGDGRDYETNSSYGGAGLDVLIGNTGGDRESALDWIAARLGKPRLCEVALAHIGGSPGSLTDTKLVVASGTGKELELSSWSFGSTSPVIETKHLKSIGPFEGWNSKLETIRPVQSRAADLNPFVHGRIGADSNLWLTLRRIDTAGQHIELHSVNFGRNGNLQILDFAIAHQAVIEADKFLLLTPILASNPTNQPELRVLVWSIDAQTGAINLVFDTGNLGDTNLPTKGCRLQIVRGSDDRFILSYLNKLAQLTVLFFAVNESGTVSQRSTVRTLTVTFNGPITVPLASPDFALGRLNSTNFVALVADTNCGSRLDVWKESNPDCDAACDSKPLLATNSTVALLGVGAIETPPLNNFALCRIDDALAISAVVYGSNTLRLDTWKLTPKGEVNSVNHSTLNIVGLQPGKHRPHVKVCDGSTVMTSGDNNSYLNGRLEQGQLQIRNSVVTSNR